MCIIAVDILRGFPGRDSVFLLGGEIFGTIVSLSSFNYLYRPTPLRRPSCANSTHADRYSAHHLTGKPEQTDRVARGRDGLGLLDYFVNCWGVVHGSMYLSFTPGSHTSLVLLYREQKSLGRFNCCCCWCGCCCCFRKYTDFANLQRMIFFPFSSFTAH